MRKTALPARLGIAAFLVGIAVGATMAQAGHAYSAYGYYGPHAGYSYRNDAGIHTTSTDVWASTGVSNTNGVNVPTGYMSAMARSYREGALCKASAYRYNDRPLNGMSELVFGSCGRGAYYSKGITQAWNGSGYNSYWTFQSPNQNY